MQDKFELKIALSKLKRQKEDIQFREKAFYLAQQLWQTSKNVDNYELHKRLFSRMARAKWWKSIDKR